MRATTLIYQAERKLQQAIDELTSAALAIDADQSIELPARQQFALAVAALNAAHERLRATEAFLESELDDQEQTIMTEIRS